MSAGHILDKVRSPERLSADRKLQSGLFFRLLPYQILLIVISAINGIVDGLYASNAIGKAAMSAIGLYGPLNHFLYAASIMLVSGSQMLYGRYLAKDRGRIQSVFSVNLIVSAGLSVLTVLVLVLGVVTDSTRVLVSEEADLALLNQYILGQAVGIPALLLGQQLFAFLSLENQTKRTMAASIVCFVANIVLNHLFIVAFGMGTFGLGLSSSLSLWLFFGVQAWYYFAGKSEWKLSLRACRWKDALQIVQLGYPGALSRFVEMFRCIIVNFLVLKYVGSVGLSAFAASNSLLAVVWAYPFGLVAVERMLYSISVGEGDRRSLTDTLHIVLTRGMLIMLGIVALLILSAEPLTRLFYRDVSDPVYHMTVMGFRLLPLCMPLAVATLSYASYAQVAEKKTISIVLPIVEGAAGVVICSLILIPLLGMNGLYISNILNGFICSSLVVCSAWISLGRFPKTLEDLLALPADFGVAEDERLDITVRNIDDAMTVSGQVIDFCSNRGIDQRRSYYAGLCLEEMAGNVVLHGFTKDNRAHSLDIRVSHSGDDVILRLRDNCIAFDPAERARVNDSEDGIRNLGIRLVFRLVKDVQYQNLLGLNVLMMRI